MFSLYLYCLLNYCVPFFDEILLEGSIELVDIPIIVAWADVTCHFLILSCDYYIYQQNSIIYRHFSMIDEILVLLLSQYCNND